MGDSDSDSVSSAGSLITESEFSENSDASPQETKKSPHFITPGVSKPIFEAIKKKTSSVPPKERLCVLLCHEIDLALHLDYLSKEDYIIGVEDVGWERNQKFADNATVFMLRSIYGNWKQPVAFAFYDWPLKKHIFVRFIKEIAMATKDAGLNLIAMVVNHAYYNIKAVDLLLQGDGNVIKIDGQEIIPIFDPCTLLLAIRNNLCERDLSFKKDNVLKVAKWEHLVTAYEIDRGLTDCLTKITEKHIIPEKINKSSVTTSAQIFSSTFAGFLNTVAGKKHDKTPKSVPIEATATAELIYFLDKVFDSVNGRMEENPSKPLRGPVRDKSPHSKVWAEAQPIIGEMKFLNEDPKERTWVFEGWQRTLTSFELLKKKLLGMGYDCFAPRSFNLDPLDNCFDVMQKRTQGKKNSLTCKKFSLWYNVALRSKEMANLHATGGNCEPDGLSFLVTIED